MGLRKITTTQTDSATWSADGTIGTDIERVGVITRIDITVEITPSATLVAANQPDGIFRLVQNFQLLGGSHTYFTLPADDGAEAGVLLHYLNMIDGFGPGHGPGGVTAPSETYVPVNWVLHAGSRPRDSYGRDNPFDLTAFVPAKQETQLRAEWRTSSNDVMDDTVTISSAVMRFTIHRVLGEEMEIREEMANQRVNLPPDVGVTGMVPAWASRPHATGAATTDFDTETEDLPVGKFLKRIGILAQDATNTRTLRAGDEATEVAIKSPGSSESLLEANAEALASIVPYGSVLTADSGAAVNAAVATPSGADFNGHAPEGIIPIDLRPRGVTPYQRDYGWDLRRMNRGDLVLGFIISNRAAGDDLLILWEQYQTYHGALV
jgi:hypothetical protein|tara:strand:- start:551 stop:1687 length:1137 start_codon:yes stop_codon:yes gene_type:complete